MSNLSRTWRIARRSAKEYMPYVRRRVLRKLNDKYQSLAEHLASGASPAASAAWTARKPLAAALTGEVCLFVSHCAQPELKPHVIAHLRSFRRQGIALVLLLNTDLPHDRIRLPADLLADVDACFVRANLGFDIAAWSHAVSCLAARLDAERLYLVNDSIVGPLDESAFDRLIGAVRRTEADVVGLTEHHAPRHHLQSYFLAFNRRASQCEAFRRFFGGALNLPSKELVIDVYETHLTQVLDMAGLTCVALFPNPSRSPFSASQHLLWRQLIEAGFPYVKRSVLDEQRRDDARLLGLLPPALRG